MAGTLSGIRAALRQRRHHRAFRIAPPLWNEAQQAQLDQVIAGLAATTKPAHQPREAATELDGKALADAATQLWRAQRKLAQDGDEMSRQARQATRYLRTCHEALAEAGLTIQDHDGDVFHPGRSLEVLAYHDDPSLTTETVLETVQPSVYFTHHRIQMGQVIVGCPTKDGPTGEDNHA